MQVDHVNGNILDNRRSNLRICTKAENNRNVPLRKDNKSGYKGVSWDTVNKKWIAKISFNSKRIHLGRFTSKVKAAKVYDKAAKKYHGQFAFLNFREST